MAGNEEGGVRTKVSSAIPLLLVMSLLAASAAVLFISDRSDAAAQFDIEGGKTLFSPGEMIEADADDGIYVVKYGQVYAAHSKLTDSSGATVTSSTISPADHTFAYAASGSERKGLGITVPDAAGEYTLVTEFELESGGKRVTKTYPIKVVDPIVLTADVKNSSSKADVKISVQFIIDGVAMDIETDHKNISIESDGTHTFTYEWITDNASAGKHTYSLKITSDDMHSVDAANAERDLQFYVGQEDHTWLSVIFAIVLVILLIVLMWVIRKPVKNFGKPKGRR